MMADDFACATCGHPLEWTWVFAEVGYERKPSLCPVCGAVTGRITDELLAIIKRAAEELEKRETA